VFRNPVVVNMKDADEEVERGSRRTEEKKSNEPSRCKPAARESQVGVTPKEKLDSNCPKSTQN